MPLQNSLLPLVKPKAIFPYLQDKRQMPSDAVFIALHNLNEKMKNYTPLECGGTVWIPDKTKPMIWKF